MPTTPTPMPSSFLGKAPLDFLEIPGLRDLAVAEYSDWQRSQVNDDKLKEEFRKARDTAHYAASCKGHDKIVQLLLQKGADVNAQGGRYGNVFHATSAGRQIESFGRHVAFFGRHDTILQLLLEKRAEANAQGGEYGNALQAASLEDTISSCSCDS